MLFNTFFYLVVTCEAILFLDPLNVWFELKTLALLMSYFRGRIKAQYRRRKAPQLRIKPLIKSN